MINDDNQSQSKEALENQRYEIFQNSDEWKTVEFHLKSSIASEIKIDKIISVKNTLTYNQFESLTNNHLWSYGWYNLKGDDYDIQMKKMREHSFELPPQGANFKVGAIFDSSNSYEVQSVYVLCKIIIGKSFCKLKQEGVDGLGVLLLGEKSDAARGGLHRHLLSLGKINKVCYS